MMEQRQQLWGGSRTEDRVGDGFNWKATTNLLVK